MSAAVHVSRRAFLKIVPAAGAGLVLGVRLPGAHAATGPQKRQSASLAPSAYLQIDPRGEVTIWASKSEMGQGVRTALPMIVAEELDADWSRVRVEQAWADPRFGDQDTGGSSSVRTKYEPMR
jgi:isoquinoline 1-oxidoreductase beta subunit